uniref:Uncharacterized protein n=1 Tax=Caenorhabditis japonica TaxID=281687 RepID=A0A8R1EF75_CAEJA
AMATLITGLGEVEENLSTGCSNETQLAAVVAAFFEAKSLCVADMKNVQLEDVEAMEL